MNSATTCAPPAHAFDPAEWLENFRNTGGWWVTVDGRTTMGWQIQGYSDEEIFEARRQFDALCADEAQRNALREYLAAQAGET